MRKGMEGKNDSQCFLLLLLTFTFYNKLYSFGISMYFFLLLSHSFISTNKLSSHTAFALSALVALSENGGNPCA